MKKIILTSLLALGCVASAMAVPARRGFIKATGPDGQPIDIQLVGDEFGHYTADSQGRMMLRNGNRFVYATEAERAARCNAPGARMVRPARVPGQIGTMGTSTFPTTGKQKAIVVLVEFQDQKFMLGDKAHDYFSNMLMQDGFSEYGGTGCVHEYFISSSQGAFDCDFDLYGPLTLKNKMSYYGGNDANGQDKAPEEMVIEACRQLDDTVDFSQYDRDGDGVIDNIFVIYAGRGEASDITGEYEDTVWPHSWDVTAAGQKLYFDGKLLKTYGCSNEWEDQWSTTGNYLTWEGEGPDGIGTFVHEFSHVLGLPDLYHTSNSSANYTPGTWDVMDYGPYNNNGCTPPAYSAYERNAMGWIELTELTDNAGEVNIPELNSSNFAYCITNPSNSKEFFILETRNREGWDAYIPSDGMLVWHIDYKSDVWYNNQVNNTQSHQYVDLVEADRVAAKDERNGGDCYPGTKKVTNLALKWWNNRSVGFTIQKISRNAEDYSVDLTVVDANGNIGGETPEPGPGTELPEGIISVADVLNGESDDSDVTVRGYIVGYANNAFTESGVKFTSEGCKVSTNLVLAGSKEELLWANTIPVQLVKNTAARNDLNLSDNPSMLGACVDLPGTRSLYFSVNGLKNVKTYALVKEEESAIEQIEITESASDAIYDLQGRRVTAPSRGLYIINGRKTLLR